MNKTNTISQSQPRGLSTQGWATFLVGLILIFSTDSAYRIGLGSLLVHPYLAIAPVFILFFGVRLFQFPSRFTQLLVLFWIFYSLAQIVNGSPREVVKVASTVFTVLFFFQAVQREKDVPWVALALIAVGVYVGAVASQAAFSGQGHRLAGINALEGIGNKNAQSLFTLPGLFFSVFYFEKTLRQKKVLWSLVYGAALAVIILGVLFSANRSGYIGAILIALALVIRNGFTLRAIFLGALISVLGSYLALNYAEDIIEHKFEQTVEGYGSDTKRQRLIAEAFIIGLENPLFGLGHDGLHEELPNRVHKSANAAKFDSHNLLAYLFGGAGFPTFLVFMLFIGRVFFLPRLPKSYQGPYAKEYREAYFWARTYVVLFMVRGIFTREILYSPTFLAGLGLVLSYWYYMYRRLIAYQKQSA